MSQRYRYESMSNECLTLVFHSPLSFRRTPPTPLVGGVDGLPRRWRRSICLISRGRTEVTLILKVNAQISWPQNETKKVTSGHALYIPKPNVIYNVRFLNYARFALCKYLMVKYDVFFQGNSTELTGNEHLTLDRAWGRAVRERGDGLREVGRTRGTRNDDVIVGEGLFVV